MPTARHSIATAAAVSAGVLCMLAAGDAYAPQRWQAIGLCVPQAAPRDPAEELLARHVARRYLIGGDAAERTVGTAFRASRMVGLDPLVVLAVISVESRFNPIAESVMGAKGLMQIIPRFHLDKLGAYGGEAAVFDPDTNILVGAEILQEYVYRTGSLEAGLQFYNGAFSDPSAQYAQRVLAERERLLLVLRPRVPVTTVAMRD